MVSIFDSSNSSGGISLIRSWTQLFRPTLGIFAALAGCGTIYTLNSTVGLRQYLLTAIVLICMTSASFAIDDYWDVERDRINHPERPLPSKHLSLQQAWWAAAILFACAWLAAIPLGLYSFILIAVSSILLWNYSHLLTYSGILGNFIVAAIVASLIFLGSLVAHRPIAMLYPMCFLFGYILAKEIIWDIHDSPGDRGIVTVANLWGNQTAFAIAWGLLCILMASIPIAFLLLPMTHPLLFASFTSIMLLSLETALIRYQQRRDDRTYRDLIFWGRLGMLFGIIGMLGSAAPL